MKKLPITETFVVKNGVKSKNFADEFET